MEWMCVRVFSKSVGHFRPVALASQFAQFETPKGVQGTRMESS